MTDREKIINIVEQNKLCIVDVDCKDCQYKDKLDKTFTCGSYKLADLLIAANIGDVTEWKEQVECAKRILQIPTLPDGKTDFEYKGERIQDIARQRDEYKHRAEVAERNDEIKDRALLAACVRLIKDEADSVNIELLARVVYTCYLANAEKEVTK